MRRDSLLDANHPSTVEIQGHAVGTEEAALTWEEMTTAQRAQYQGMTDLEIVEAIYSDPCIGFNYLPVTYV